MSYLRVEEEMSLEREEYSMFLRDSGDHAYESLVEAVTELASRMGLPGSEELDNATIKLEINMKRTR